MASPYTSERGVSDTYALHDHISLLSSTRCNTSSSVGSSTPIPSGTLTLNISGNCSRCHHRHVAVKIQVEASSSSEHVGEVRCGNCHQLWLGFGKRNSTRISLISSNTVEIDPVENEFRSALIYLVRSSTTAVSTGLPVITESPTLGPSRETSVRSVVRDGIERVRSTNTRAPSSLNSPPSSNNKNNASKLYSPTVPQGVNCGTASDKHRSSRRPRFLTRLQQKLEKLPVIKRLLSQRRQLHTIPTEHEESSTRDHLPETTILRPITPPAAIVKDEPSGIQSLHYANEPGDNPLLICGPSASPIQAVDSIRSLDGGVLTGVSPEQRISYMREALTTFDTLRTKHKLPGTAYRRASHPTQVDLSSENLTSHTTPPSLRSYILTGVGGIALTSDESLVYNSTLNETDSLDARVVEDSNFISPGGLTSVIVIEGRSWSSGSLLHHDLTLESTLGNIGTFESQVQLPPSVDEQELSLEGSRRYSSPSPPVD